MARLSSELIPRLLELESRCASVRRAHASLPFVTTPKFASPSSSETSLDNLSFETSQFLVNQYCDAALARSTPSSAEFFVQGFITRRGDTFVVQSGVFGMGGLMVMQAGSRNIVVRGESVGGVGMDCVWFWCRELEEFLEEGEVAQKWMVVVPDGIWREADVNIWDVRFKRIFPFGRPWISRFQRPIDFNSSCEELVVKDGESDFEDEERTDYGLEVSSGEDSSSEKECKETLVDY